MSLTQQAISLVLFAGLLCVFALFYRRLTHQLLPSEDQGILNLQIRLQEGAPMKTPFRSVSRFVSFLEEEKDNIDLVMLRYGRNFSGTGQNLATGFVALKHWDYRAGEENTAQAIRERAMKHFRSNRDAQVNISISVNGCKPTAWISGFVILTVMAVSIWKSSSRICRLEQLNIVALKIWISVPMEKAELKVNIDQKQAMANGLSQSNQQYAFSGLGVIILMTLLIVAGLNG